MPDESGCGMSSCNQIRIFLNRFYLILLLGLNLVQGQVKVGKSSLHSRMFSSLFVLVRALGG